MTGRAGPGQVPDSSMDPKQGSIMAFEFGSQVRVSAGSLIAGWLAC